MKPHHIVLFIAVSLCLYFAYGCANEGVSKSAAVQATAWSAGTTWFAGLTGLATGGWSFVVGLAAGLVRLLFATSTTTAAPGSTTQQGGLGLLGWLLILLLCYVGWKERALILKALRQPMRAAKALTRKVKTIGRAPSYRPTTLNPLL